MIAAGRRAAERCAYVALAPAGTRCSTASWSCRDAVRLRPRGSSLRPRGPRAGRGLLPTRPPRARVRVFYGHDRVPAPGEPVAGGSAKFQRLAARFPNRPDDFTLLTSDRTGCRATSRPLLVARCAAGASRSS